ncbi:Peptidase M10 serralysin C terminal [Duganella sp. CF517]|uniref:DUF4214 domain-containing protein n=1 Tax=Duganella sp. CF517 TaxID=1881038 RepID=UPI0008C3876B|nr:DUF4214 domain-containing protein [Duganella sp. CF517]SEN80016.1 Peptidase M10 serralysin C terminal [Duganella sp. CF517]
MVTPTGINAIDALLHSSWTTTPGAGAALTYSFLSAAPSGASADDANGFKPMTAAQQAAVKVALDTWAAVANVTFTQVASGGDIQVGTNNQGNDSGAYAYLPSGWGPTYMYTNNQASYNNSFGEGDYGRAVLIHEFGHTLGLKHPGDYDSSGNDVDGPFLPTATDNLDYTQMSYNTGDGFELNGNYGITPMMYDILAIQYMYGANMSYHAGADTYRFGKDAALQCIWDADGIDTLDFSACTGRTDIDLNQMGFSSTAPGYYNISIAYGVTIERAIAGSGGSSIFGNDAGNVIMGGAGADWIYQGKGSDTISGGGGSDTVVFEMAFGYYALSGSKTALTVAGEGVDVLTGIGTLDFTDRYLELSKFSALHGATAGADAFIAGAGSELFSGGAGTDTISYNGARANFTIAGSRGGGSFTVSDKTGAGGVDVVGGVERLLFSDGSGVALDVNGHAGQTYRLYQAAFDRTPDLPGMGFWLNHLDSGMELLTMSQNFLQSQEGVADYGTLSDAQFVTTLYANVLHRAPDAAGYEFHLGNLTSGINTRAVVLMGFSESAENRAALVGVTSNGIDFTVV